MKTNAEGLPQLIARVALGIGFLIPVADRLGLIGQPGGPNINWGDWAHFTGYAYTLMPILSKQVSDGCALLATALEGLFGVCLLLGYKTQWNAVGTAVLLLLFAVAMILSQGFMAPVKYPVFVFIGAALLLACVEKPKWSIDRLILEGTSEL